MEDHVDAVEAGSDGVVVSDVDLSDRDRRPGGQVPEVLGPTGRQIIHDGHRVAVRDQPADEMAADEAATAGDQGSHGLSRRPRLNLPHDARVTAQRSP